MKPLSVVTFNVGSLLEPHWDRRASRLAEALMGLAPDVVCLQEVAESPTRPNAAGQVAEEIARLGGDLTHWAYGGLPITSDLAKNEPGLRFGSAVLARQPVEAVATHPLPVESDDASVRIIGWELFHARVGELDVFSTHLCAAPKDANHRRLQVQEIDRLIKAARGPADGDPRDPSRPTMPPILCGDFNAEPDSDEIRFLSGFTPLGGVDTFYQDAWRVGGDGSGGFTNDWRNPFGALLNIHRKRIDYVFVGDPFLRPASAGRVLECHVVLDEVVDGVPLSDHYGVLAVLVGPSGLID